MVKLGKFGLLTTLIAVTACGIAQVDKPDSNNPAHCIAAFNYGRSVLLRGANPNMHGALSMSAREAYEMIKLEKQGVRDRGESTATAFTLKYWSDTKTMLSLLKECGVKEDSDPDAVAANDNGSLMAIARHTDPLCKGDAACESGAKYQTSH